LLSSAKTPKTGGPNPVVVRIFAPASASFFPSSLLTKFLLGRWTNSFTPASMPATSADELTECTWTNTPAFFPSSTTARKTSSSWSLGPGTGVSAISPVNFTPISASLRISARAISGVLPRSAILPEGMTRGPLMTPFSMWSLSVMFPSAGPPPDRTVV
jgi:hypothetical protein